MKNADRCLAQLLIPINLNKLKQENELHIYDAYSHRADGKQSGNSIFVRHWNLWTKTCVWISIVYILKSLLTMPPSTATSEISFSVLKRVKTYLRATTGQEWLWAWSLPHIHIDIQLPLHAFVDKFNNTRQKQTFCLIVCKHQLHY